jgi:hypothetical protein
MTTQLAFIVPAQRKLPTQHAGSVEAHFARWYEEYPRKVARGDALKAYRKAIRKVCTDTDEAASVLLAGLRRYRFNPDPSYRPHPATWLNGERWLDDDGAGGIDPVLAAAGLTAEHFR